jgi:radical SAM superfamily enzyme YgiQ (UPF0313 family)
MKILLIFPPIRETDNPRNTPHGIAMIAAVLRQRGHEVHILDINGNRFSKQEVIKKVEEEKFEIVGIGGLITVYNYLKWIVPVLREVNPHASIIAGGSLGCSIPDIVLKRNDVDIVIDGEGEITIIELVEALRDKRDLHNVRGIYFKEKGRVVRTPTRNLIRKLDALPLPAYDLLPMETYLDNPVVGIGRDIDIVSSRGCPYYCTFCYRLFGNHYRFHSSDYIIRQIKFLKKEYDIDFVSFQDDEFMANKKRVYEFCDKILKEKIEIKWSCTGRVNLVDEEILRLMKKAGCTSVSYGIESGSQKILDLMKKRVTVEQAKRAILLNKKVGLRHPTSFILGMPGETPETVKETIEFCKELNIPLKSIMFATPYPGTELYQKAKAEGRIVDEEEFIMKLGDAVSFTINLTDTFSDEELIKIRDYMIKEVQKSCRFPSKEEKERQDIELYGERLYKKSLVQQQNSRFKEHRRLHGFNE